MARRMLKRERKGGRPLFDRKPKERASDRARGFSLPELLAVLAMLAIAVAIGIPIVNEQLRIAEVRAAADDLVLHLRAARMISVTKRKSIAFEVNVEPANTFNYEGLTEPKKVFAMRGGVRIAPASDRLITFKKNGSVEVAASIVIEGDVSGACERWTATVNTVGLTTLSHERAN